MRLEHHPDHAVLLLSATFRPGINARRLHLTDREMQTLHAALRICEKAADMLSEDDTGDFRSAAAWLWGALN